MTNIFSSILLCLILVFSTSCNKKKTVIISTFTNGKSKELIEVTLPMTKDSSGLKKVFFENGKLRSFGQSRKGKRQGKWICYFQNGKPEWEAIFKDDIEDGEVTCYKENGDWRKNILTNGIRNGKTVSFFYDYFDSTYCYSTGQYINGLEQGLWTKTDTAGILLVEMTYVDGKTIGYFTNRYKNGKLRLIGEISKDGSMKNFRFYDENGTLKKQKNYFLRKI
jgi:uncharacterized protein